MKKINNNIVKEDIKNVDEKKNIRNNDLFAQGLLLNKKPVKKVSKV